MNSLKRALACFVPLLSLAVGCASNPPPAPAVTSPPPTPTAAGKEPFFVREADLPKGFPPPGPVGEVIVKNYPACRMARVRSADLGGANQDRMFGPLFNHIKKNDIPMTAPVAMDYPADPGARAKPESMAFIYGDPATGRPGDEGDVRVLDVAPMTVMSVGLRGGYDSENFLKGLKLLRAYLDAHQDEFTVAGPPRYMGYNSPFVLWFVRYAEVQIPVTVRR